MKVLVQEMLNSSDEAFDQYEILGHSWSRSNLRLKILEKRTGAEFTVDAADAKVDCPHQLAFYIVDMKVGGKHSGRLEGVGQNSLQENEKGFQETGTGIWYAQLQCRPRDGWCPG